MTRGSLARVIGCVVAAVSQGCGDGLSTEPPTPGRLEPSGARSDGTHSKYESGLGEPKCVDEYWVYEVSRDYGCLLATQWAERGYRLPCGQLCGSGAETCVVKEGPERASQHISRGDACTTFASTAFLYCEKSLVRGCMVEGRRPSGLCARADDPFASVGAWFAECAHLESAAVVAFERLTIEATALGAPEDLLERLRRAQDDERRHSIAAGELARRFDAAVPDVAVEHTTEREVFQIALENGVEGVIRETYGAAAALYRSMHARDARVAEVLREIASDECEHASLSWDVARWLDTQLNAAERAEVSRSMHQAIADLRRELAVEPPPELRRIAGVPSARAALAMLAQLEERVWSLDLRVPAT
ncbi:MAG: hypothetical protein KF819_29470 [Labilithrix sp.]|nr:hypothetical protein [Labilithrix sp.]